MSRNASSAIWLDSDHVLRLFALPIMSLWVDCVRTSNLISLLLYLQHL